jgi:serine/threonine protein kinase
MLKGVAGSTGDLHERSLGRVGRTLNSKWRIDRLLEVGGMGAVYEVTHRNGRRAAIKLLHAHIAFNPEVRKRFLREGYVANKIDHPGALAILDDDVAEDGCPFLVMELLAGESLAGALARFGGRLPPIEAVGIAAQVLEVLEAAHGSGIIHRDIKPGNIFITRLGHTKLLDFGLARVRDGMLSLIPTAAGVVMGTPGYMAPEQARGLPDEIDARSDLFAVGAVLFRAISGRRIHESPVAMDVALAGMREPAPSLGEVVAGVEPAVVHAIDRALAFDKAARWQSAREMFEALRACYGRLSAHPVQPRAGVLTGHAASGDAPSLIAQVAFGPEHDKALADERRRTREAVQGLSTLSLDLESEH